MRWTRYFLACLLGLCVSIGLPLFGDEDRELAELLEEARKEAEKPQEKRDSSLEQTIARRLNELNPRITLFGDGIYWWSQPTVRDSNGKNLSRRFSLRGVEVDFRADIDPYAKGVIILGAEEEAPGEYGWSLEEGYVLFPALPGGVKVRLGKFRSPLGIVNKLHRHDLPQTTYPLVIEEFLGEEGLSGSGGEVRVLFPISLECGFTVQTVETEGAFPFSLDPNVSEYPVLMGYLKFYTTFGESWEWEVGASAAVGFRDRREQFVSQLLNSFFFLRWRPPRRAKYTSLVLQGELFYLTLERPFAPCHHALGGYLMLQHQLTQNLYWGGRYDFSELPVPQKRGYKLSGYVSFYTTEFLRLRLGYEYHHRRGEKDIHSVFFQLTFVIGSHPVEPYWVNR